MRNQISNATASDERKRCPRCDKRWSSTFSWCQLDGTALIADKITEDPTSPVGMCRCGAMPGYRNTDGTCSICGFKPPQVRRAHDERWVSAELSGVTNRGLIHLENEDDFDLWQEDFRGSPAYVMSVCDGVSSSVNAADASSVAALTASSKLMKCIKAGLPPKEAMRRAILFAHKEVYLQGAKAKARGEKDPPESTIVAAFVYRGQATIGWVGDSRAYLILRGRKGDILQLTKDHTVVQELLDEGKLTKKEAQDHPDSHKITQCLGATEPDGKVEAITPGIRSIKLPPGSLLVLCSDGLWNYVKKPAEILWLAEQALQESVKPVEKTGDPSAQESLDPTAALKVSSKLVSKAIVSGGGDNITVATLINTYDNP